MQSGAVQIRKCKKCGGLIEEETFISWNNLGGVLWTDGYFDGDMWADPPQLVKCPHCREILWIDDQELLGRKRKRGMGRGSWRDFLGSEPFARLQTSDYFQVIDQGGLDGKRLRYVRIRAWQWGNHARRACTRAGSPFSREAGWTPPPMSERERKNLEALLHLLDEGDEDDRLMKAEACRELGRFDTALRLLEKPFEDELLRAVDCIRELIRKKDDLVREVR